MIKCEIGNINIKIAYTDYNDKVINSLNQFFHERLDPLDPNRYRIKQYNIRDKQGNRLWDGRVKICDFDKGTIPTGLYQNLKDALEELSEKGYHYEFIDNRKPAFRVKIPNEIKLNGNGLEKDLTLRDYQYESVKESFKQQVGVLLISTGGGKTGIAVSIFDLLNKQIQKDDDKLLFIAPNKSVMNQLYLKYVHYLGEDKVGIWGDGDKDLSKSIVVATYQSISSALKKPKVKLTKKNEKWIQRLATKYYDEIVNDNEPRNSLYILSQNLVPKYKYEQEDPLELGNLYLTLETDEEVVDYFKRMKKKYEKLLYKKASKEYDKYNEAKDFLSKVIATIVDECQGASAKSYQTIFQYLTNARMRIGLTGTLPKQDNVKMIKIKAILGTPIKYVTNNELINRGVNAKPHIKMVKINQPENLEDMIGNRLQQRYQMGLPTNDLINYQISYDLGVVNNEYFNKVAAQLAYKASLQVHKTGKAVMIMLNSLEHGENIAKELDELGAKYDYVKGEDNLETRNKVIDRVKNGELPIVLATKIFEAGIDIPNIQVFIQCSGGKSYVSLLQRVGRILRIQEDKKDVYVFDLINTNSDILYRQGKERFRQYKAEGFDIS